MGSCYPARCWRLVGFPSLTAHVEVGRPPRAFSVARLVVLVSLAVGIVTLGLLEISLRSLALLDVSIGVELRRRDPYAVLVEPHGQFGFRQRPGAVVQYRNGTRATANAQGYRGPQVVVPKPGGVFRVVLLGGSTTHGWGVNDQETIDRFLENELAGDPLLVGRRPEVVNLAYDGYDAYQLYERLRSDGLALDPDLIIVNEGINDVRHARVPNLRDRDVRSFIWEGELRRLRRERQHGPSLWTRTRHLLWIARVPGFVRSGFGYRPRTAGVIPQDGRVADAQIYFEAIDNFELNLVRIDSLAASVGAPVLYSTPPSALLLQGAPPRAGALYQLATPQATQAYRDSLAARMSTFVARKRAEGRDAHYIAHDLHVEHFLDDCHLTPEGNRLVAQNFANAVRSQLRSRSGF